GGLRAADGTRTRLRRGPPSNHAGDKMTAARSERARLWLIAAAVGLFACAFRVANVNDLSNDHYMHLAWAQQLLFGELPGRDFVDPGMPLLYALSAMVQHAWPGPFGHGALPSGLLA